MLSVRTHAWHVIRRRNGPFSSQLPYSERQNILRLAEASYSSLNVPPEPFRVVFMGRDSFSSEVFKTLYDAQDVWSELHITTNADARVSHKTVVSSLKILGEQLGVPVTQLSNSKNCWREYSLPASIRQHPSALLIAASFGKIIPTRLLNEFPQYQRLNVHGSIVPSLRGAAPVQWALLNGLSTTGASIIELAPAKQGIDTGDCLATEQIYITEAENHRSLCAKIARVGGELLVSSLRQILHGRAKPRPQDNSQATYAPAILPQHAVIHWSRMNADYVHRLHRGISHQRHLSTSIPFSKGRRANLLDLYPVRGFPFLARNVGESYYDEQLGAIRIGCAEASEIAVSRIQTWNRAAIAAKDWWNGVPQHVFQVRNGVKFLHFGEADATS